MPKYVVRVELHAASEAQYYQLHDAMEAAGYGRTTEGFRDADGEPGTWHLPTAEYYIESESSARDIRERARLIASSIFPNPSILVTAAGTICWSGLPTV